jgi:hypothetical protein
VAVLRAASGLRTDDPLDLDLGPAPAQAHFVRERERLFEVLVVEQQHLDHGALVQSHPLLQDTVGGVVKHGGHAGSIMPASAG